MRLAEIVMAGAMAIFSLYLMWMSTKLEIGWIPDEGPGGGAFSFWLSLGMLICCIAIIVRWIRRDSPPSRSDEPFFMDARSRRLFLLAVGALGLMIASMYLIGVYGAIPLFLIFYMRYMGRHTWKLTAILAVSMPVATFCLFELALKITLPKGATEPLFYPIFDIYYDIFS